MGRFGRKTARIFSKEIGSCESPQINKMSWMPLKGSFTFLSFRLLFLSSSLVFLFFECSRFSRVVSGEYFVFTFVRDPYTRSVSSFYYDRKKSSRPSADPKLSFREWLSHPQGTLSPIHWSSQLGCLLRSGFYSGVIFDFYLNALDDKILVPQKSTTSAAWRRWRRR